MNRILASFFLASAAAFAADLSGQWEFSAKTLGDTIYARVTLLKTEGNKLTGFAHPLSARDTKVTNNKEKKQ